MKFFTNRFRELEMTLGVNNRAVILLFALSIIFFMIYYLSSPFLPGNDYKLGWWGWYDQGAYLKEATAIYKGILNKNSYIYPIGYPLIGAAFYWLIPNHIFFFINLICYLTLVYYFYKICKAFVTDTEAILLSVALIFFNKYISNYTYIVPWTNVPIISISYYLFYTYIIKEQQKLYDYIVTGVLLIFAFHTRMFDFGILGSLIIIAFILKGNTRNKIISISILAPLFIVSYIAISLVNYQIFNSINPSYVKVIKNIGFFNYNPLLKLFSFVYNSKVFLKNGTTILSLFPYLIFITPGIILLLKKKGVAAIGFPIAAALTIIGYFNFNDLWPTNLYRFWNYRYIIWLIPLGGLLSYITIRNIGKPQFFRNFILSLIIILFPLFFTFYHEVIKVTDLMPIQIVNNKDKVQCTYIIKNENKIKFDSIVIVGTSINYQSFNSIKILKDNIPLKNFKDFQLLPYSSLCKILFFKEAISPDKLEINIPLLKNEAPYKLELKFTEIKFGSVYRDKENIETRNYIYGDKIIFSKNGNAEKYINSGFSGQENEFRWTDGKIATMKFAIEKSDIDRSLKIQTSPFGEQEIKIFANKALVGSFISSKTQVELVSILPKELLKNNELILRFEMVKAHSPCSIGMSDDKRILGFAFRKLVIE